jgi:hypothetical protein
MRAEASRISRLRVHAYTCTSARGEPQETLPEGRGGTSARGPPGSPRVLAGGAPPCTRRAELSELSEHERAGPRAVYTPGNPRARPGPVLVPGPGPCSSHSPGGRRRRPARRPAPAAPPPPLSTERGWGACVCVGGEHAREVTVRLGRVLSCEQRSHEPIPPPLYRHIKRHVERHIDGFIDMAWMGLWIGLVGPQAAHAK